ncbi:MAG: universal stress protein [Alphaproteobacteria bacterium]|nr:universal stress protein [Alphaproteobacteria bacterium]MBF0130226.1 universal stress protein [Alphaproteobacteria bacterium]
MFKTILVPIVAGDGSMASVEAALLVGKPFAAHITGLYVKPDVIGAMPLIGEGMSGVMVEEMVETTRREAAAHVAEAKAGFERLRVLHEIPEDVTPKDVAAGTASLSMAWREETGREDEVVALLGRTSDLIVMIRPHSGRESTSEMTVNSALMESGRPVLLVPPKPPSTLGRRIVIAWNGSIEAARAVSAAMPLLTRAESVSVVVAVHEETCCDARELVTQLSWRGVVADIRRVALSGAKFGPSLLEEAAARYADLIVMGAYTHSRLRQLLLGGVTRHVLEKSGLPVLLSH